MKSEQASELTREWVNNVIYWLTFDDRNFIDPLRLKALCKHYLSTTSDQARNADQAVEPAPKESGAVAWEVHGCGNLLAVYPTPPELIPRGYLWGFDSESEAHLLCRALNKLKLYTHPSPWRERLMGLAAKWTRIVDAGSEQDIGPRESTCRRIAELTQLVESLAAQQGE